ncbi:MAG: hypothetical protein M1120_01195 [Patescibacteria group bacterium]|nr:hypothetical protein [Patescibacteria group bacterium]
MPGFGGDYRKNEKKKLSKDKLDKMARKNSGETGSFFKLPEVIVRKKSS